MFDIYYYSNGNDESPVLNYIENLAKNRDKNNRIKYNKIRDYIKLLAERGMQTGEPYIKHLDGEIWELRPLRDRILFATWDNEGKGFVLLHIFMKQTKKAPNREIEIAKLRLENIRRGENDE